MGELSKLLNIGKVLEKQLNEVGINSIESLWEIGSKKAWIKIKNIDESACLNRLCALEGAIRNIKWHDLDESIKKDLKEFKQNYDKNNL
ncbi:TfoX/Sxy family protein [Terrisporobacter petrolearius]|uniref:TfoX/Sxy family protein n=1 Tax=Terrisporobacter petrolearius TaxID=1460447 RepID=UPI001D163B67|nr:TfoX/Sxy family protein [Terrisporobacter petrolearius]MCC3865844.1 TfoX/Sxy family protein [Terrisporobacter petrolearius]